MATGGDLKASIILQFLADKARREMLAAGGDLRALGAAAEDAGRKSATAGAAIGQTGSAAQTATAPLGALRQVTQANVAETINLTAQMGRNATSLAGVVNAGAGLTRSFKEQIEAMRAEQREAALLRNGLDAVRAQFNPLFAASQQYEMALRDIADAERMGAISAQEAAAARDRAAQSMTPMNNALRGNAGATGMATAANANLFAQWNDIGIMMAAGQNPLQLAMQQGTQVSQVLMQLGGGTKALRAIGTSFLALLNPISLATIGIIALGVAGGQWLMSLSDDTKTFEENLGDLNDTLGRMRTTLDLLGNTRLSETFGSLSGEVRTLARGMLDLDRASQLQQLQTTIGSFGREQIQESWGQLITRLSMQSQSPLIAAQQEALVRSNVAENYSALGPANDYDDFAARTEQIRALAQSGDISAVMEQLVGLQQAMSGGTSVTGMSDELRTILLDLGQTAIQIAQIEAMWNGSAEAQNITNQIDQMVQGYNQQVELSGVILRFGENSAEVEAVRNLHARDALQTRLQEMGVLAGSANEQRAMADLDAAQSAEAEVNLQRRQRAEADVFTDMRRQAEVSSAIVQFGEDAAQVEEVRARHAQEVLQARLEEMGMSPDLIAMALALADAERDRAKAIRDANALRAGSDLLTDLREEATINAAIAQHGEDSLQVRELQIAAERRAFEQSLQTLHVTEAMTAELMAAWEAARGLGAADPFGSIAAGRDYAASQQERLDHLRLEQGLLGQNEETRTRIVALWEVERDLIREGIDLTSARAGQIRAAAMEEISLTRIIERQQAAWQRVQSTAESAIDGIVEKLMGGDFAGAFESLASEITSMFTELAITNPLKNALFGTNYGTLQDVGGVGGIMARLMGRSEPVAATVSSMGSVGSMQVTAASVTIAGTGAMALLNGAMSANLPGAPGGQAGPTAAVADLLRSVATGGGTRPDAITGLNAGLAAPLAAMILEAQQLFGQSAVQITSAYRSVEHQTQLWEQALQRYGSPDEARRWVAPPGQSRHNFGLASDLSYGSANIEQWFHDNASRFGLGFRMQNEPWHIEPTNAASLMQGAAPADISQMTRAMALFGTTTTAATVNLGTLGQGFDVFGNALAQGLNGLASGGSQGGLTGFLSALLTGIAGSLHIPGFATGGDHGGGLRIVGEDGPELEFTGPSRIMNADLTRSVLTSRSPAAANTSTAVIQLQPVLVNNTSRQVELDVEETTDASGQRQQRFVISDVVSTGLATPGGKASRTMKQNFGLGRPARRRS